MTSVYIVTDIEADGGTPGVHSMIAFASVAVLASGEVLSEFEAVLAPLQDATTDPRTMAWWRQRPDAWDAATRAPQSADVVMQRFVDWVKRYPEAVFAAHPLCFDGMWMNYYLRRYTSYAVTEGQHETDRLFVPYSLCLRSFAAALLGKTVAECDSSIYPPEWLGHHAHTHRAIDDALGYASLLGKLFAISRDLAARN